MVSGINGVVGVKRSDVVNVEGLRFSHRYTLEVVTEDRVFITVNSEIFTVEGTEIFGEIFIFSHVVDFSFSSRLNGARESGVAK